MGRSRAAAESGSDLESVDLATFRCPPLRARLRAEEAQGGGQTRCLPCSKKKGTGKIPSPCSLAVAARAYLHLIVNAFTVSLSGGPPPPPGNAPTSFKPVRLF